ncbi:hypothetical protein MVES_001808 [Malassezia vespertilionis]|uniref:polynucleotide adenylyltransferase n=1 Tax=Malassezia vespertilionis TaxID=2020962 RepID=A0A2N1JD47_9BASI|nr:hypothetical protein MVES_001808 [Malassezia vespertilionis]
MSRAGESQVQANGFGSDDYIAFDWDEPVAVSVDARENAQATSVDDAVREHAMARSTPWAAHVPWHAFRNVAEMFTAEIQAYGDWIKPTPEEHKVRMMVIELLQQALCSEWPDAEVRSDIDLVVLSRAMEQRARETTLRRMAACLRAHGLAQDIQVIGRAKVPIIKFVCTYGHFHVDISINQANGLQAAGLVNRWLRKQPSLRSLVMVVKQLLQQRALSEVFTGGLGSFSVTLMVLSFLQLHPKIQREEIVPEKNLGTLLMELLELYGKNFGYDESGITVRGMGGYFNKRQRGWYDGRKPFLLSIEDPHDVTNDISKGSFAVISVRSTLGGAYDILHAALCARANEMHVFRRRQRTLRDAQAQRKHTYFSAEDGDDRLHRTGDNKEPESILGSVLGISREMIKRRKEIKALYDTGVLQSRMAKDVGADAQEDSTLSVKRRKRQAHTSEAQDYAVFAAPKPLTGDRAKKHRIVSGESAHDSKYALASKHRAAKRKDPWSDVLSEPQVASSDEDAVSDSSSVAYVAASSDSDAPDPRPAVSEPHVSLCAKKSTNPNLSKADRLAYWHSKGGISQEL